LRDIWLECCGHLSQFKIGNIFYSSYSEPNPFSPIIELPQNINCENVFSVGLEFTHEYDFGSTTELLLEVVDVLKTKPSKEIQLLIRNQEPFIKCIHCNKKAEQICAIDECFLCKDCSDGYDEEESFLLPVVNSPRTGVCGYTGD